MAKKKIQRQNYNNGLEMFLRLYRNQMNLKVQLLQGKFNYVKLTPLIPTGIRTLELMFSNS
jgi:hypothetical protein